MAGNFCLSEFWIFPNIFGIFPAQQFLKHGSIFRFRLDLGLGLGFNLDLGLGLDLESKSVTSW